MSSSCLVCSWCHTVGLLSFVGGVVLVPFTGTLKVWSRTWKITWRQAHKEATGAGESKCSAGYWYLPFPWLTHKHTNAPAPTDTFLYSQHLAQTRPDILSLCPGAARRLPQIKVITSAGPRAADGTASECCKAWKQHLHPQIRSSAPKQELTWSAPAASKWFIVQKLKQITLSAMLVDRIRQFALTVCCSVCNSVGPNIPTFWDEFLKSSLASWRAQTRPVSDSNWNKDPQRVCEGFHRKSHHLVSARCCSPWPIVSLDYWIIREGNMSTQRKCLSSVLVCVTEFLIAEHAVSEGTCYQTNVCSFH